METMSLGDALHSRFACEYMHTVTACDTAGISRHIFTNKQPISSSQQFFHSDFVKTDIQRDAHTGQVNVFNYSKTNLTI